VKLGGKNPILRSVGMGVGGGEGGKGIENQKSFTGQGSTTSGKPHDQEETSLRLGA